MQGGNLFGGHPLYNRLVVLFHKTGILAKIQHVSRLGRFGAQVKFIVLGWAG